MECIAAVLGLVSHSIEGITKLRTFFADVASASKTIARFLHDLDSLLQVLYEVEKIAAKTARVEAPDKLDVNIASLQVQLEDINKDVFIWLQKARELRPASDRGTKAWFKKFWVGVNQNPVKSIREEIAKHKQSIGISLAMMGR